MTKPLDNSRHNLRDIYPATGTEITAKSWQTEAADADADEQPAPRRRREPA